MELLQLAKPCSCKVEVGCPPLGSLRCLPPTLEILWSSCRQTEHMHTAYWNMHDDCCHDGGGLQSRVHPPLFKGPPPRLQRKKRRTSCGSQVSGRHDDAVVSLYQPAWTDKPSSCYARCCRSAWSGPSVVQARVVLHMWHACMSLALLSSEFNSSEQRDRRATCTMLTRPPTHAHPCNGGCRDAAPKGATQPRFTSVMWCNWARTHRNGSRLVQIGHKLRIGRSQVHGTLR